MKYLLCMLLLVGVLLMGCEGVNVGSLSDEDLARLSEKAVVCNAPYIRFGTSCCLDQNSNSICDKDEGIAAKGDPSAIEPPTEPASEPSIEEERVSVSLEGDPSMGNSNAKVTIVEFGDFECPFCKRFSDETLPLLREEYIYTGKVRHVFKDFPMVFHPKAQLAAEAAECAHEQGAFWEFHDSLYENQNRLGNSLYLEISRNIGLDVQRFTECFTSREYQWEVVGDYNEGLDAGITGTPGFLINGQLLIGAHPFLNFKQLIEAELSKT